MTEPFRIAMWSGPRNISTAMMRAFENRPDCTVSDEPLYGAWLSLTGEAHPMHREVIASMDTDWRSVVNTLTGPLPHGAGIWYQKHMTHHLLPEMMEAEWLSRLTHVFLIRDPRHVAASYLNKRETISPEAIGVPQQARLYDFVVDHLGQKPPIVDSGEFLVDPEGHLRLLCKRLDIEFLPEMLSWPPGPRDSDGVWAPHWYQKVWQSTRFGPPPSRVPALSDEAAATAEECLPVYKRLYALRISPDQPASS